MAIPRMKQDAGVAQTSTLVSQRCATALDQTNDAAVFAVLSSTFPEQTARYWLSSWQAIHRQRVTVYDAIITFVNVLQEQSATDCPAWLRVALIDAVTGRGEHCLAAA
jgi:hypothetical protein